MTKKKNLPKLMIADPNLVGNKIFKAYKSNKNILYVPEYWFLIMFFYKIVPEFLFKLFLKKS